MIASSYKLSWYEFERRSFVLPRVNYLSVSGVFRRFVRGGEIQKVKFNVCESIKYQPQTYI